jgi:hypothetical protein
MVSQAVNEALVRFVADRNSVERHTAGSSGFFARLLAVFFPKRYGARTKSISELIDELEVLKLLSEGCADASRQIYGSFRNDVHHLNPNVADIPFSDLARKNLQSLAIIERELFGGDIVRGALSPHQPKYWDRNEDGTVPAYVRFG